MQGQTGAVPHSEAVQLQQQLAAAAEEAKQQERIITEQQGPPKRSLFFRLSERLFVALRCLPPPHVPKPGEGLGEFGDEVDDMERRAKAVELVNRGWLTVSETRTHERTLGCTLTRCHRCR